MNKLNYTEEIFNILSRGGFISNNSVQAKIKRYYDAIEDHQAEYDEYYQGIGFHLEAGDGYFFFTRKETKVDLLRQAGAGDPIGPKNGSGQLYSHCNPLSR